MADFTNDVELTLKGAATVRSVRADVSGDLDKLRSAVSELVAHGWRGSASDGFKGTMDSWDANVQKLMHAMDEIAKLLDKSGHSFSMTNQEIEKNMKQGIRDYSGPLGASSR